MDLFVQKSDVYLVKAPHRSIDTLDFGVRRHTDVKKLATSMPKSWKGYRLLFTVAPEGQPPNITITVLDLQDREFIHDLGISSESWSTLSKHKDFEGWCTVLTNIKQVEIHVMPGLFSIKRDGIEIMQHSDDVWISDFNPLSFHRFAWVSKLNNMSSLSESQRNFQTVAQLFAVENCLYDAVKYFFDFRYHANGLYKSATPTGLGMAKTNPAEIMNRLELMFDSLEYLFFTPMGDSPSVHTLREVLTKVKGLIKSHTKDSKELENFLTKDFHEYTDQIRFNRVNSLIKSAAEQRQTDTKVDLNLFQALQQIYALSVDSKLDKFVLKLISLSKFCGKVQDTHSVDQSISKTINYSYRLESRTVFFKRVDVVEGDPHQFVSKYIGKPPGLEFNHYVLPWKDDKLLIHHRYDIKAMMVICDLAAFSAIEEDPAKQKFLTSEYLLPVMSYRVNTLKLTEFSIHLSPRGITTLIYEEPSRTGLLCHLSLDDMSQLKTSWAKIEVPSPLDNRPNAKDSWQSVYSSQDGGLVLLAQGENKAKNDPLELYCYKYDIQKHHLTRFANQNCQLNFGLYNAHFWTERKNQIFSFLVHRSAKAMLVHCLLRNQFITIGRTTSTIRWVNFSRKADEYFFLYRNKTPVGLIVRKRTQEDSQETCLDNYSRLNPTF